MERRPSWFGFLLASIGTAVGLGNIWRFSAVVGQTGGPYLVGRFLARRLPSRLRRRRRGDAQR